MLPMCRAVAYASELGVPIYVTENGIPAKKDDGSREEWINGYLTEVPQLLLDAAGLVWYGRKRSLESASCLIAVVPSETAPVQAQR